MQDQPDEHAARLTWAHTHGYTTEQAQRIATDPEESRRALALWLLKHGLNPDQAQDHAMPADPMLIAEYAPLQQVTPEQATKWPSQHPDFPAPRMTAAPGQGTSGGRPSHVYSRADLLAWKGPQRAARVDPMMFGPQERVTVAKFSERTGKDRSTLSKAVNNTKYQGPNADIQVPERGEDRRYNARALATFVNSLPGRRGRVAKKEGQ